MIFISQDMIDISHKKAASNPGSGNINKQSTAAYD